MAQRKVTEIAEFVDKYGDKNIVRKTRHGWQLKRLDSTPSMTMTRWIGNHVGRRIREERLSRGVTMRELGIAAGLKGTPKERIHGIESSMDGGIRIGTIYCIATALGLDPKALLPSVEEALAGANIHSASESVLKVKT